MTDALQQLSTLPVPPNRKADSQDEFDRKVPITLDAQVKMVQELNADTIPKLNALSGLINQQLPYIKTVAESDTQIHVNANNIESINNNSSHMNQILTVEENIQKICFVTDNMQSIIDAPIYADRAEAAAEKAESIADIGIATPLKAGIVKPGIDLTVDASGMLSNSKARMLYIKNTW